MNRLCCLVMSATLASGMAHAQQKDPPKNFTNSIGMKFVWIRPGSFEMGSPAEEKMRRGNETQHKVVLTRGFYMAVHTVTQEQWHKVMGNNPSYFQEKKEKILSLDMERNLEKLFIRQPRNLPVENVSWDDCQEFISKLRGKEKKNKLYRLPSEAEWEYACRAGTTTPFHFGASISTSQANYLGDVYRSATTPVGSFPANAWGLYDMHGNVWQWCQDWDNDYPINDVVDPHGPYLGTCRVLRGGSWANYRDSCRSAYRERSVPESRRNIYGFRLCFSVE